MSGVMAISGGSFCGLWDTADYRLGAIARRPTKEKARRGLPGAPLVWT